MPVRRRGIMKPFKVVGKSIIRKDALEKVTGRAIYGADIQFPHQLYGAVYRSPLPHARILNIDTTKASALPGVRAIVTGNDFHNRFGQFIEDQPFLAYQKVRYAGEPVVAIAAEHPEIAAEAVQLVKVDFEPLPAVLDPFQAMEPGSPLVHENWNEYNILGQARPVPGTNICDHFTLRKGDVETGWKESDVIIENEFNCSMLQHVTLETHCAVARVDAGGYLTIWTPAQSPFMLREQLARALNMSMNNIRIICTWIGGGFGSKYELRAEPIAVTLAFKAQGRPVKVVFSRQEDFVSSVVRGPAHFKIKTGAKKDGTLVAQEVKAYWDTGAYVTVGPRVNYNAGFAAAGPYKIPHIKIDGYCICTNKPVGSAYRGFGVPEIAWAHESQMDALARELNLDPLELRLHNALEEGSISATGERLFSVGLKPALEAAGHQIDWYSKPLRTVTPEGKLRGKGIACFCKLTGTPSTSSAIIRLNEDGSVTVLQGGMELGQGVNTVIAQIVAEELGISVNKVSLAPVDTAFTPYDKTTTSSRLTFHIGNAVLQAARDIKEQLKVLAARAWHVPPERVVVKDGLILEQTTNGTGRVIPLEQISKSGILKEQPPVIGHGSYSTSDIFDPPDVETRQSSRPTVFWMYGAQAAEVEVDPETGQVKVLKISAAHDVGRAINPDACRQQIEGAIIMGLGHTLLEEMILEHGIVKNASMVDYKIPTAADATVETVVSLIESNHPEGPFGAKGIGEPGLAPTAAAIGNAVNNALGARLNSLPLKPENILAALKSKGRMGVER